MSKMYFPLNDVTFNPDPTKDYGEMYLDKDHPIWENHPDQIVFYENLEESISDNDTEIYDFYEIITAWEDGENIVIGLRYEEVTIWANIPLPPDSEDVDYLNYLEEKFAEVDEDINHEFDDLYR
jgi:acetoin utilization deacetylase AcuC-like enzyme